MSECNRNAVGAMAAAWFVGAFLWLFAGYAISLQMEVSRTGERIEAMQHRAEALDDFTAALVLLADATHKDRAPCHQGSADTTQGEQVRHGQC